MTDNSIQPETNPPNPPAATHQSCLSEDAEKYNAKIRKNFIYKILLAAFDKLLLGGITFFIGLWIHGVLKETEKVKDTILSVSQVNTEFVTEQRKRLIHSMAHFTQEFKNLRGVQSVNSSSLELLREDAEKIKNSLSQMVILNPEIVEPVEASLLLQVDLILEELSSRTISDAEIDQKLNLLHTEYKKTLEAVRSVSIHAVEQDRRAVLSHFEPKRNPECCINLLSEGSHVP